MSDLTPSRWPVSWFRHHLHCDCIHPDRCSDWKSSSDQGCSFIEEKKKDNNPDRNPHNDDDEGEATYKVK